MEKKRRHSKLIKLVAIVMTVAVLSHTYYSFYSKNSESFQGGLAGNVITEDADKVADTNLKIKDKVILIGEWLLVISLMVISVLKEKMEIKVTDEILITPKKTRLGISKTDIDSMYELIKEKKAIKVKALAKYFNVSNETILEWGRVLEEANLIKVHYPAFGDAILLINEEVPHAEKQAA